MPEEVAEGPCKGWQSDRTAADCHRDWTIDSVRYTFDFVGLLDAPGAADHLRGALRFAPGAAPDALFVNSGVWNMVLRRCDLAAYEAQLRALLEAVRDSGYAGPLYWLGQTRPNWGVACWAETVDLQHRLLGLAGPSRSPVLPASMRVVPVDRLHLAGNVEAPRWWWRICLNATLCAANPDDPAVSWHASRDGLHPSLLVQTAVAQHILNLLCPDAAGNVTVA